MKDRIIEFLRRENKTSSQFADEIGVQPSSVSHIISGRNNPSLDFVLKMLQRYRDINSEWLLFGTGSMRKQATEESGSGGFDEDGITSLPFEGLIAPGARDEGSPKGTAGSENLSRGKDDRELAGSGGMQSQAIAQAVQTGANKRIARVVLFFDDRSFEEYNP